MRQWRLGGRSQRKNWACWFFLYKAQLTYYRGACLRENCPFFHPTTKSSVNQEMCRDYLRGECTRERCPFLHSDSVVQVCRDYIRGECARGSQCPYHHILGYKGPIADPCRDYQRGLCDKGNACPRAHVPEYVEICRNYLRHGTCSHGTNCRHHHLPSNAGDSMDTDSTVRPAKVCEYLFVAILTGVVA